MRLSAETEKEEPARPRDGTYVQVLTRTAFAPHHVVQGTLVACTFVLWAWLTAGGAAWLGAIALIALLAGQAAAGISILRSADRDGVWIALSGPEQLVDVVVLRRGPVGHLGIRSADGAVSRVPGTLHRSAPVIKIRGRLVPDGGTRWQRLTWDPAAESVTDLARRIQAGHPSTPIPAEGEN